MTKRNLGRKNASKDIKTIRALNKYPDSVIACRVYRSTDYTHTTSGSFEAIDFTAERRDAKLMHSNVTNPSRVTVPINGWYFMWGNAAFEANGTGVRILEIRQNGTAIARARDNAPSATLSSQLCLSTLYYLAASDYVELHGYQNSGGNLGITAVGNHSPEFAVAKFPFNDLAKTLSGS